MNRRTAGGGRIRGGSKHFALRRARFEVESEGGNPTVGLVSQAVMRVGSPTPTRSSSDHYMRDYHRASDPSSPTGGCKLRRQVDYVHTNMAEVSRAAQGHLTGICLLFTEKVSPVKHA